MLLKILQGKKEKNPNYDFITNSFLNLYNYNDKNVTKYAVYIPFF